MLASSFREPPSCGEKPTRSMHSIRSLTPSGGCHHVCACPWSLIAARIVPRSTGNDDDTDRSDRGLEAAMGRRLPLRRGALAGDETAAARFRLPLHRLPVDELERLLAQPRRA